MVFVLLLLFAFCANMHSYGMENVILNGQPPFLGSEISAGFIRDHATEIPLFCYAVSEDATKNPLLMVGLSPSVGLFVKHKTNPKILAFNIYARNSLGDIREVIDNAFSFGMAVKEELYVTLFTRSSPEYQKESDIFFKEKTHKKRLEAIINKLKADYTLNNPQIFLNVTLPIDEYDLSPEGSNAYLMENYSNDRNVICTGFDAEKNQLKVHSIDLRETDVFGIYNPEVIYKFTAQVVQTVCHENKEQRKKEEAECSGYTEGQDLMLRVGDKWDHRFFEIVGPNIQAILRKIGDESLKTKKIDMGEIFKREIKVRPDGDWNKEITMAIKEKGKIADILDIYRKVKDISPDVKLYMVMQGTWFYPDDYYDETFARNWFVIIRREPKIESAQIPTADSPVISTTSQEPKLTEQQPRLVSTVQPIAEISQPVQSMQNIESSSSSAPPVLEQAKARVGFRYNDHDLEVIVNPTGNVSDLKSAFRSAASISRIPLDQEKELLLIYHGHPFNSQDTYDTTTFDKQPIFVALVLSKTISTASHDPEQKPWYSRWFNAARNNWRSILATVGAVGVVGTIGALLSKWGRNVPPTSAQKPVAYPSALTGRLLPAK